MTITRTDVHRPAELTTEDYTFVGCYDNAAERLSPRGIEARRVLRNLGQVSSTTRYASGAQCDHCGALIRYVAVVRHTPTGDHLAVGETCLDNRFSKATSEFQALRKSAKLDREVSRIATQWAEFQTTHAADWDALAASTNSFVQDVLAKGRQFGVLSDRQFEAIVAAVARDAEFDARRAEAKASAPAGSPVPTGRLTVTGRVVSRKTQSSPWGTQYKFLLAVTAPDGGEFRIWGTEPTNIDPEVGDSVTLTATLSQSDRDPAFGFFTRPTKATVVSA